MLEEIPAKTIVSSYTPGGRWFGINYNMNLYKGCCHGCIYCDSRSACYHVEEFDRVRVKKDALQLVRNDLARKVKHGIVGTGAMSDPYNPFERELLLTRHALELIDAYGFGASVMTKSDLVVRDMDVMQSIREHSPVEVLVSITAAEDSLGKLIEPRAALSSQRFAAVQKLSQGGIFTGVVLMPVLPFLTDGEENIRSLVRLSKESGARFLYPFFGVTLRMNQRDYFYERLDERFPGMRAAYEKTYGQRYACHSPHASKLWKVFQEECEKCGLLYRMEDMIRECWAGYQNRQLTLF